MSRTPQDGMPGPGAPGLPVHACAGATGMPARTAARHRAGRLRARHAVLILLMGAAALGAGCTLFPQGAYWPPMARRAAEGAAAEPRAPAAQAGRLPGECLDGRGVSPERPVAAVPPAALGVGDDPAVRACVESFGASAK